MDGKENAIDGAANALNGLTYEWLNRANWSLLLDLFGERGACGNCWCMYFRLSKADFVSGKANDGNKMALKQLVWQDMPTGVLVVCDGVAIGWCAVAPRDSYPKIERSRVHKRIDDNPVWSVSCFYIDKRYRRMGVSVALLNGVVDLARQRGIATLEGYPTIPTKEPLPDAFAWIGLYKTFVRAGFEIVDQSSRNRPMMRYYL